MYRLPVVLSSNKTSETPEGTPQMAWTTANLSLQTQSGILPEIGRSLRFSLHRKNNKLGGWELKKRVLEHVRMKRVAARICSPLAQPAGRQHYLV